MTKTSLFLGALVLLGGLLAGCAPETYELLSQTNPSPGAPGSDYAPGDTAEEAVSTGDEAEGVISSNGGTAVAEEPGSSGPGSSEAGIPGGANPVTPPPGWLVYEDPSFGFSISYPDTFVILDESKPLTDLTPVPVHRVRFQTKGLASGPLADRELPQFAIEVFSNPDGAPLEEWLNSNGIGGSQSRYAVGNLAGLKISSDLLLAPNTFYYFASGQVILKLTPLGQYSEEMLLTFQVRS